MSGNIVPSADKQDQGGGIKVSEILGTVGAGSAALGALAPITAPITIPLGIISSLAGGIVSLFGGNLSMAEWRMMAMIKSRVDQRNKMGLK